MPGRDIQVWTASVVRDEPDQALGLGRIPAGMAECRRVASIRRAARDPQRPHAPLADLDRLPGLGLAIIGVRGGHAARRARIDVEEPALADAEREPYVLPLVSLLGRPAISVDDP